jgi:hypothetical protein
MLCAGNLQGKSNPFLVKKKAGTLARYLLGKNHAKK